MDNFITYEKVLKKNYIIVLGGTIFVIGLILDYSNAGFIEVDKNFINNVFIALVTLAALSATVLTIIASTLREKHHGFFVKEILNFDNNYIKIKNAIPLAIISILLAVYFLAINFINAIVLILVFYDIFIISLSLHCWKIIAEDDFSNDLVRNNVKMIIYNNNENEIKKVLSILFNGILTNHDQYRIDLVKSEIDFIRSIIELINFKDIAFSEDLLFFIDGKIKKLFSKVNVNMGFLIAVDNVLEIYNSMDEDYKKFEPVVTIVREIEKIQYKNNIEVASSSIIKISKGLADYSFLDGNDKRIILYKYFKNIYENEIIGEKLRRKLLVDHLTHLTEYNTSNSYEYIKQETLLFIIRDFVLTNENINESRHIFANITKGLYQFRYSKNKVLIQTIALIYLSLYLYSEHEVENLNINHRKIIKKYINYYEDNINNEHISFQKVVDKYFIEIIEELFNLKDNTLNKTRYMEYFSPNSNAKTSTWNRSMTVNFAIYNFLIIQHRIDLLKDIVDSMGDDKGYVIEKMITLFEYNKSNSKMELIKRYADNSRDIAKWIGQDYFSDVEFQQRIFEYLNSNKIEIHEKEIFELENKEIKFNKVKENLEKKFLSNDNYYGFDEAIPLNDAEEIKLKPIIFEKKYYSDGNFLASRISNYIEGYINYSLKKEFRTVTLSFDQEGVNLLLEKLEEGNYNMRNYTYINDLAIDSKVRKTESFLKLSDDIEDINMVKNLKPINSYVFFNSEALKYNIDLTYFNPEELEYEKKLDLIESFKISENIYRINNAYYTESQAIDYVMNSYEEVHVRFKFKSKFSRDGGIIINFS